jgi:hypothetical protein
MECGKLSLLKFERLWFPSPDIWQDADELLQYGWRIGDGEPISLQASINWKKNDSVSRTISFNMHALHVIDPLLAAYSDSGNEKYLSSALRIGLDWVKKHPRRAEDVSPMAWYEMAVGRRCYRLGYLYQAANQVGFLNEEQRIDLWTSLHEHCAELADDNNILFHNNQGFIQVAGQLALGRRFQKISPFMNSLHKQGVHRLKRMLHQQFTPDGVHREHSPDYHRMVADTLLGLVRAGLVEDPELLARVDCIENALAWFVTPTGSIANFGDSDSRCMTYSAAGIFRKWTTPLMRAVASNGATGSGWPKGLQQFPESGYAVVRLPDPGASEDIARDTYLAQTAAFHSRTHKHCDDLSFIWHERGQPLLVDAGRFGYIGKTEADSDLWQDGFWYSDPMRIYMESTRAHNTLEFDGKNALRKGVKPYGSALVQACERSGIYCIETRCKQHHSIWHDRILLLKPGQWLVVFDVFTDNLKQPHEVKQWFHLAPGHKAQIALGGYDVTLRDGSAMAIRSLIDSPAISEVISGKIEEPIQGWWSEKERVADPADALAFSLSEASVGVFATLFSLGLFAKSDIAFSRSNVTGRKVQLSWEDIQGKHLLKFERGEHFQLSYELHSSVVKALSIVQENDNDLHSIFGQSKVILEYGIGPATQWAVNEGGQLVICVHDDLDEIRQIRRACILRAKSLIMHHVERHNDELDNFGKYAGEVWEKPWFRHPDLINISGMAAIECLEFAQKKISKKTKILWWDFLSYKQNQKFKEFLIGAVKKNGDALIFDIEPQS